MNYVFYDFETSGLNYYFDQPIQLAAKLVDENFNVIDKFDEKCRLRDGVIPSPVAMLITKTNLNQLNKEQSFYEFMDKVHTKFTSWSPAIFIGYNNINFDEKFLRSSFYQSLYAPYLTNTNKNSRADLFKMILALCNLNKSYLNIPTDSISGKRSLKLEKLSENNGIKHEFAHDAMSDVDATIGIANIIKSNEPEFWEHMIQFNNHSNVSEYVNENSLVILPPTTATGEYLPACFITSNPDNAKEMIFYNLNEDVSDDVINSRTRAIGGLFRNKTLKKVKSNDYPIFLKLEHMNSVLKEKFIENKKTYIDRAKTIHSSSNFVMNINQYLVDQLADYQVDNRDYLAASEHVDEMLYNGFTGPSDWLKIEELKKINDAKELSKQLNFLQDKRLVELYKRKMFSDKKNMLTDDILIEHKKYISQKIFNEGEKLPWTTLGKARHELSKASNDERFKNMSDELTDITNYLNQIEKDFS